MSDNPIRPRQARLGVSLAWLLLIATATVAAAPSEPPAPPEPPSPPEISVRGFTVRPGETVRGNVVKIAPSANIEGTVDGDVYLTSPSVRITGVVTGDVFVAGSQVDISGEVKKSVRCFAANVSVDGTIGGTLLVTGATLTIGPKAKIVESVTAFTGQLTHHGTINESLEFTGGTAVLGGTVREDATLTADAIEIEQGAKIQGDVSYSTRHRMDEAFKAITGGDVTFDEEREAKRSTKEKRSHEDRLFHPSTFSVGIWVAFFVASYLFGCALLAMFKHHEPRIDAAIGSDTLRTAGLGFVSILVTIAVCLSGILILTLPFVAIYLIAYAVAVYLAKIPVAVWAGRRLLGLIGRTTGPFTALLVGLIALYLVFMIPILGVFAQIAVALLGLGSMIAVYIAQRQARRAAAAMASAPPEAPPAAS